MQFEEDSKILDFLPAEDKWRKEVLCQSGEVDDEDIKIVVMGDVSEKIGR